MSEARSRNSSVAWVALVADAVLGASILVAVYGPHMTFGGSLSFAGDAVTTLLPFPVMFAIGVWFPRWVGVAAALWLAVPAELGAGYVNPFVLVIVFGPWIVGVMVRDRRRLAHQLEETGRQLRAESHLLAEESVRYERSRIARELHDIVAHGVSVMVVQAYAGERLATRDRRSAATAFDHISEAAEQAQVEIRHLVGLLTQDPKAAASRGLHSGVAELVAGAVATGLSVNLLVQGDTGRLPDATSLVAYRTIQESITNALKHAPGAPVGIVVDSEPESLRIEVVNASPLAGPGASLADAGGGHGLVGMRDRVLALGGRFASGRRADGAWEVSVTLPVPAGADTGRRSP